MATANIKIEQNDRVTATVGVTRNLGDYNSVRLDFQWETAVAINESVEAAAERAWELAEKQVEDKLAEYETE